MEVLIGFFSLVAPPAFVTWGWSRWQDMRARKLDSGSVGWRQKLGFASLIGVTVLLFANLVVFMSMMGDVSRFDLWLIWMSIHFYASLLVMLLTAVGKGFRLPVVLSALAMIWATVVVSTMP